MKTNTAHTNNYVISFFVLTFILTLPAYTLISLASNNILFSADQAFSFVPLSSLAPITAALILTFKEYGWADTKALLGRTFDQKRMTNKRWYWVIFLLLPILYTLSIGIAKLTGQTLIDPFFPPIMLPIMFFGFFSGALGEETGWMGYAFEPMQARMGVLKATFILGLIWAIWHIPIYIYLIVDPIWITAQIVGVVALRFLLVWLFNNTGKSLFIQILFHTVYNLTVGVLPVNLIVSAVVVTVTAIVIVSKWGLENSAENLPEFQSMGPMEIKQS